MAKLRVPLALFCLCALMVPATVCTAADAGSTDNPLCWTPGRIIHPSDSDALQNNDRLMKDRIALSHAELVKLTSPVLSSNSAYAFSITTKQVKTTNAQGHEEYRNDSEVLVFNERPQLFRIAITDVVGVSDIRWVNENMLFLRIWWGRLLASDVLLDVEEERIVASQPVMDGSLMSAQARDYCTMPEWKDSKACKPVCVRLPE